LTGMGLWGPPEADKYFGGAKKKATGNVNHRVHRFRMKEKETINLLAGIERAFFCVFKTAWAIYREVPGVIDSPYDKYSFSEIIPRRESL